MSWLANELGYAGEDVQVYIENMFALSSDIHPCETCARLRVAATVLDDFGGERIAALEQVINEFARPDAPISEEQMASIADALAGATEDGSSRSLAAEYLRALEQYVGILSGELGISTDAAVALFNEKHAPSTEDVNVIAYVQAQLALLGG